MSKLEQSWATFRPVHKSNNKFPLFQYSIFYVSERKPFRWKKKNYRKVDASPCILVNFRDKNYKKVEEICPCICTIRLLNEQIGGKVALLLGRFTSSSTNQFTVNHALSCKKRGFVAQRHDRIRNLLTRQSMQERQGRAPSLSNRQ